MRPRCSSDSPTPRIATTWTPSSLAFTRSTAAAACASERASLNLLGACGAGPPQVAEEGDLAHVVDETAQRGGKRTAIRTRPVRSRP
jgi:hypothetical protein